MNFCWVTLPVKDFEKSLDFYHGLLGLPVDSKMVGEGIEMAMLGEKEQPKVEIIRLAEYGDRSFSSDITVGLAVESMEATLEFLKEKGIPVLRGPISPNPNLQFIYINDPDGYEVQLVEMRG